MSRSFLFSANIFLLVFIVLAGCNKIELNERSKITISGNTFESADFNATYDVHEGQYLGNISNECQPMMEIYVLKFSIQPEAALWINLQLKEWYQTIPEGTFNVVGHECEVGLSVLFSIRGPEQVVYDLSISSGTMKIKEDEGTYDINFDFTISTASGGGKITGNFTGMIVM
jgi:hypothetical protein